MPLPTYPDLIPSAAAAVPQPTLIRGGTVLNATGAVVPNGQVLLVGGRIAAVGAVVEAPAGVRGVEYEVRGKAYKAKFLYILRGQEMWQVQVAPSPPSVVRKERVFSPDSC